jgi:hypothetical protein
MDDQGFRSRQGLVIFLFITVSRPAVGSIQPPIQWVPVSLSLGVKRSGREADHSPPSSAEVKNAWSYTFTPKYNFMTWCSVKAQGQLCLFRHAYINFDVIATVLKETNKQLISECLD